jgi:hypothetical protein
MSNWARPVLGLVCRLGTTKRLWRNEMAPFKGPDGGAEILVELYLAGGAAGSIDQTILERRRTVTALVSHRLTQLDVSGFVGRGTGKSS